MIKKILLSLAALLTAYSSNQAQNLCFRPAATYSAGVGPVGICSADFNGDGHPDVAVANNNSNNVSILLGSAAGTLSAAVNYLVGVFPFGICSADFNGDGHPDVAVTNSNDNSVSILLGSATGTLSISGNYLVGSLPEKICSADFNSDGHPDVAVANYGDSSVSILLGNAVGAFSAAVSYTIGADPYDICCADFNSDGHPDVAITDDTHTYMSILFGSATGTLSTAVPNGTFRYRKICSADFNSDGHPDVAALYNPLAPLSILLGSATGTLSVQATYSLIMPSLICSADFNIDGHPDVAVTTVNNNVSILLGSATGALSLPENYRLGNGASDICSADFNNDGYPDIAAAISDSISILLSNPVIPHAVANPVIICQGESASLYASGANTYTWSTGAATATISVTPTVSTTYSVVGTNTMGCSNTATVNISVVSPPTPQICEVTTDSASHYNYNIVFWENTQYPAADSFKVYRYDGLTNSYIRLATLSKDSSRFVDTLRHHGSLSGTNGDPNSSPQKYVITLKDTCGNESAKSPYHVTEFLQNQYNGNFNVSQYQIESSQSNPVTGYALYRDNNNTGVFVPIAIIPSGATSATDPSYSSYPNAAYRVDVLGFSCTVAGRYANPNQVQALKQKSHSNSTARVSSGIASYDNKTGFNVYPNPGSGIFTISAQKELGSVEVYNLLNQLVYKINSQEKQIQIDLSTFDSGVYYLRSQSAAAKLIKQ
ncbi:MAG: T9SS type A sorting domain-containing protein [Bacteroidetes bacterium]|nr:T9SS type A sorting domain-containing protein [Bacteroidota bacterium]